MIHSFGLKDLVLNSVDICWSELTFHLRSFISCFQLLFSLDFTSKILELCPTSTYIKFLWKLIPSFFPHQFFTLTAFLTFEFYYIKPGGLLFLSFIFLRKLKICNWLYSLLDPVTNGSLGSKPLCKPQTLAANLCALTYRWISAQSLQWCMKSWSRPFWRERELSTPFSAWPFVDQ